MSCEVVVLNEVAWQAEGGSKYRVLQAMQSSRELPKGIPLKTHRDRVQRVNTAIASLLAREGGTHADLGEALSDRGFTQLGNQSGPFYVDSNHLNRNGARVVLQRIGFENMIRISDR